MAPRRGDRQPVLEWRRAGNAGRMRRFSKEGWRTMSGGTGANGADRRRLTPEDLYRLTFVGDPQLSPDGALVAFVYTTIDREGDRYRSQIWTVPADGSAPPRRFTAGPSDSAPRWSPDGAMLAFLAKRGGADARAQLRLIGARGGEAWPLTDAADVPDGAADPQWSPDGRWIAFTSKVKLGDGPAAGNGDPGTAESGEKAGGSGSAESGGGKAG